MPQQTTYISACRGCNNMYAANTLHNGRCSPCRETHLLYKIHTIATAIAVLVALIALAGCSDDYSYEYSKTTAYKRCYRHGDWLETPYCKAAANDMENI